MNVGIYEIFNTVNGKRYIERSHAVAKCKPRKKKKGK